VYTIRITYGTGNSFHSESGLKSEVGYAWEKLEDAQEVLRRIREHYAAYSDARAYEYKRKKKDYSKESWFYKDNTWEDLWQHGIVVPDGKGGSTVIDAFWCGYFESLDDAEIVLDPDENSFRI